MISFGRDEREQTSGANHPTLTSCLINYESELDLDRAARCKAGISLPLMVFTSAQQFIHLASCSFLS